MKNKEKVLLPFSKIMSFVECGEEAEILLNEKIYKIGVKLNNENMSIERYFINEESFINRDKFLEYLCKQSLLQLTDNSMVTLISIGDSLKVDTSWFKTETENLSDLKEHKPVLFRNMIMRFCIVSLIGVVILAIYIILLISDIKYVKIVEIIWVGLGIFLCCVVLFPKNIKILKKLIKYGRKQITEIEDESKHIEEKNHFGNIYFLEEYFLKKEKYYFEIIKYDDILWIFKELNCMSDDAQNYGEIILITKDNKIHKMGYISNMEKFKQKSLSKNPSILFGRSKTIIKQARELYKLNIRRLDNKIIASDYIRYVNVLLFIYVIFNN